MCFWTIHLVTSWFVRSWAESSWAVGRSGQFFYIQFSERNTKPYLVPCVFFSARNSGNIWRVFKSAILASIYFGRFFFWEVSYIRIQISLFYSYIIIISKCLLNHKRALEVWALNNLNLAVIKGFIEDVIFDVMKVITL